MQKDTKTSGKAILIIVLILAVAGVATWWLLSTSENVSESNMEENTMMKEEVDGVMEGVMMEKTEEIPKGVMMEGPTSMESGDKNKGTYEIYTPEKLAQATNGDVVLFFHASWCPTCRAAEASINETGVPDGLTILKLDYDRELELRQKYGVTVQHTFVQVDENGDLIKKWTGSPSATAIAGATI
ncbi:thioredoxin family protein [Candidatus Kaiserbacteria bacterium]|nr:thioredoxin family protein [Candidatus Kaiserbacteria bacterium]